MGYFTDLYTNKAPVFLSPNESFRNFQAVFDRDIKENTESKKKLSQFTKDYLIYLFSIEGYCN